MNRRVFVVAAEGLVLPPSKEAIPKVTSLVKRVFDRSLADCGLSAHDVQGFVGIPALSELRFLEGHYQATKLGLFDGNERKDDDDAYRPGPTTRTVDTCGASPVTAILEARRMIQHEGLDVVAVAAGDIVGSMSSRDFLKKAETTTGDADDGLESPAIVRGYDKVTAYQRDRFGLTRDQARMAVALESYHAARQPDSLFARWRRRADEPVEPYSLEELERAPMVTDLISVKECAWRADGAGCVILTSEDFATKRGLAEAGGAVALAGGGEGSGPLYPKSDISESHFGTAAAMKAAYSEAGISVSDVGFFGLYDCFPICLLRAVEAAGLADDAGTYVEAQYARMRQGDTDDPSFFPINTHGGLLCYGAPFAVPAFYSIVEAIRQLHGNPAGRKIPHCKHALVYGNGGVFSSSAVAILSRATM